MSKGYCRPIERVLLINIEKNNINGFSVLSLPDNDLIQSKLISNEKIPQFCFPEGNLDIILKSERRFLFFFFILSLISSKNNNKKNKNKKIKIKKDIYY